MLAFDSDHNFVWIGGPGNGSWFGAAFGHKAVDGSLQVEHGDEDPRFRRRFVRFGGPVFSAKPGWVRSSA
jgi:hypothetical protein